jgi:hypothetical protein
MALLGLPLLGHAAIVTLPGSQFDLRYDDGLVGLFGAPSLAGGTVFFTPSAFVATSTNGIGLVTRSSTVTFELLAHDGSSFASVAVGESGDYRLAGAGSTVGVSGVLTLSDASNSTSSDLAASFDATEWNASAVLDSGAAPWAPGARSITVSLQNILSAVTPAGIGGLQEAFIEKKFAGVALEVKTVPTPGTLPLAALALGGLLFRGFWPFARHGRGPV